MTKVIKATDTERAAYQATGPVYPLYGWVQAGDHRCAVEDLRGSWSKPDPIYEIIAPKGFHFEPSYCRHLLAHSLRDVAATVEWLEPCPANECGHTPQED